MAIVRIKRVQQEIKALRKISQRVKHLIDEALEKVQADATFGDELDLPMFFDDLDGMTVRRVAIVHQKHDYRLLYLHLVADDIADFWYVIRRKNGYKIDWSIVDSMVDEHR